MTNKNESDSYQPVTDKSLEKAKELNSKESGPLTEHYDVKGFTEADKSKKTQDYNIY